MQVLNSLFNEIGKPVIIGLAIYAAVKEYKSGNTGKMITAIVVATFLYFAGDNFQMVSNAFSGIWTAIINVISKIKVK